MTVNTSNTMPVRLARLSAFALLWVFSPAGSGAPISLSAVEINQISFRGGPYSTVGEISIDRAAAGGSGFVNVVDPNTNTWLTQNLPVFSALTPYNHPTITTRLDLTGFVPGGAAGTPIGGPANLIIDYHPTPSASLGDVLARGTSAMNYTVGAVENAVGGVGTSSNVNGPGAPPNLVNVNFNPLGIPLLNFKFQPNHPNVQAGFNQCAPAAMANSFQFLEDTTPLNIPHPHVPGFGADGSLVGELDIKTGRTLGTDRFDKTSSGVWPMDGKLSYIAMNGLKKNIKVKHLVNGSANNGGTPLNGGANYTHMGVTSHGAGAKFDIDWIIMELMNGEDVEMDLHYQGPNNGRHYVEVVGAGYILGMPFLLHMSDKTQADMDPTDMLGTGDIDFEWINNATGYAHNSNAIIDQVISQSYVSEPGTLALVLIGVLIAFLRRGIGQ